MASVDGYTKAGADAAFAPIGHTHEGGGALAFKKAEISNTLLTESTFLGGTTCVPHGWSIPTASSSVIGLESSDGSGWGYDEAGIYQLTFKLKLGFPGVVPEAVTLEFIDYFGVAHTEVDFPVLPPVAYRSLPGFSAVFTTQFYYSPDKVVTGTDQSAHQITLWCAESGVTYTHGNNASSDTGAFKVSFAKLG